MACKYERLRSVHKELLTPRVELARERQGAVKEEEKKNDKICASAKGA